MSCKSCDSLNQSHFGGEMGMHFMGLKNLDKPTVWVFPQLLVCMDCGFTEFNPQRTNASDSCLSVWMKSGLQHVNAGSLHKGQR